MTRSILNSLSSVLLVLLACEEGSAFCSSNDLSSTEGRKCTVMHETKEDLIVLSKKLNPAIGYWDPLNLVDSKFLGTEEQTIGWLRHAEIKHGRVAMFAFCGYIAQNYIRFPWAMTLDGTPFPKLALTPPEQWDALPAAGKLQIILFIGFLEWFSEFTPGPGSDLGLPHYTSKDGTPGKYPTFVANKEYLPHPIPFDLFDPLDIHSNNSDERKERGLLAEINNGRLAMIGIFGFLCAHTIPGSVPVLNGVIEPYDGQVMAPFESNILWENLSL